MSGAKLSSGVVLFLGWSQFQKSKTVLLCGLAQVTCITHLVKKESYLEWCVKYCLFGKHAGATNGRKMTLNITRSKVM